MTTLRHQPTPSSFDQIDIDQSKTSVSRIVDRREKMKLLRTKTSLLFFLLTPMSQDSVFFRSCCGPTPKITKLYNKQTLILVRNRLNLMFHTGESDVRTPSSMHEAFLAESFLWRIGLWLHIDREAPFAITSFFPIKLHLVLSLRAGN